MDFEAIKTLVADAEREAGEHQEAAAALEAAKAELAAKQADVNAKQQAHLTQKSDLVAKLQELHTRIGGLIADVEET